MCTVLLPPGVNPIAVKYIISYQLPRGFSPPTYDGVALSEGFMPGPES